MVVGDERGSWLERVCETGDMIGGMSYIRADISVSECRPESESNADTGITEGPLIRVVR